jgi:Fe-S cluster biogenesis protein NfuA
MKAKDQSQTIEKIELALDEIRPFLKSDGGDISFIELQENGTVLVELHGACTGCSVNQMTLKSGVEMTVKKHAPEVQRVLEINMMPKA